MREREIYWDWKSFRNFIFVFIMQVKEQLLQLFWQETVILHFGKE